MMRRRWTHLLAAFATVSIAVLSLPLQISAAPVRMVVPDDIPELAGVVDVHRVVRFKLDDQDLVVWSELEPTGGMVRVNMPSVPGLTRVSVHYRSRPDVPAVGLYFRLMHSTPETTDGPKVNTTVYT